MENIFMGHKYSRNIPVGLFLFLSSYLDVIDGMNVLHRVHHNFADLNRREKRW